MKYLELREMVKNIIPRRSQFEELEKLKGLVKEKGRKSNYKEFRFDKGEFVPIQRLLNKEEIGSFLEVSLRAAHCPMPLNADVWDGLRCGFGCKYCYADSFRSSLYTSFFDNSKDLGMRHCNPTFFKEELAKLFKYRGKKVEGVSEVAKAISMQIPIRLGIRFEDFLPIEERAKVSLELLNHLSSEAYPVMINTKSALIGRDSYVNALAQNQGGSAVHITMISADDEINKSLEPGAPKFKDRIQAAKNLTSAGVRVVARIEPFMVFINDNSYYVDEWMREVLGAGIRNITFDTYSWSASAPGVRRQMEIEGWDFDRMFLLMSDAQWLGSLLLGKFIEWLKDIALECGEAISCSTFDFGNVPSNDQDICCEVGDLFLKKGAGFSYGNNLSAVRYIQRENRPVTWEEYDKFVEENGGWLSDSLKRDVFLSWNLMGNAAYFPDWAPGIEPCGEDKGGGKIWRHKSTRDFRLEMLTSVI